MNCNAAEGECAVTHDASGQESMSDTVRLSQEMA